MIRICFLAKRAFSGLTITLSGWISGQKSFPWHSGYEVNTNPCHVSQLLYIRAAMYQSFDTWYLAMIKALIHTAKSGNVMVSPKNFTVDPTKNQSVRHGLLLHFFDLVILEQRQYKDDSTEVQMYVNFEIAALFSSPYCRVKKRGNFKTNILLVSV